MAGSRNPHQATVEEYHTDDSDREGASEKARRSPATPGQANVAAKRSLPSDLGREKAPAAEKVTNIDLQSDSGYSSHTAATMSSADSGPSAKSQSPPAAPVDAAADRGDAPADAAMKRRPTLSRDDRHSSQSSPRKPLARTASVSSRNRPGRERQTSTTCPDPNCTNPNCSDYPSRGRRPKPSPLDSGLDISYAPFDDARSQRSDPNPAPSFVSPQSPTYTRQPDPYVHGAALVQPNRTRRASSTTRPMSYAGESPYGYPGWGHPGMLAPYQSPPQDIRGPPPSSSAYHGIHPQMAAYPMLGASPSNGYYQPQMPMTPGYDMQRPPMPSRNSSNFNARRPMSGVYGAPVLTQDTTNLPSARYANTASNPPQPKFARSQFDTETSSEYDDSEEEDLNKAIMGPPAKPKGSHQRQPSSKAERRMSQSLTLEPRRDRERERDRESRLSRTTTAPARSKSISRARPALVQHPKAQSALETSRDARITVENSRRRQSYQGSDKVYRTESNRRSKVYDEGGVPLQPQRRRRTDASLAPHDEVHSQSKLRDAEDEIEAYQQRMRGSEVPLNDQVHKAAKRGSRIITGPSDAGTSRSKGSDKASRVSVSNRTTVTNGGNGEIRLRVDASAPLSLQFNGDMEGRTLHINPTEDGMADIVIANPRGEESTYRSERGSIYGSSSRKSVVRSERSERPRREHDEQSIKTSRSSQSRRDRELEREEPRPLRRREKLYYDEGRRF